jgi:hypothetical protein
MTLPRCWATRAGGCACSASTAQERLGEPTRLTPTGHAAAHTALRARALRPREHPIG